MLMFIWYKIDDYVLDV